MVSYVSLSNSIDHPNHRASRTSSFVFCSHFQFKKQASSPRFSLSILAMTPLAAKLSTGSVTMGKSKSHETVSSQLSGVIPANKPASQPLTPFREPTQTSQSKPLQIKSPKHSPPNRSNPRPSSSQRSRHKPILSVFQFSLLFNEMPTGVTYSEFPLSQSISVPNIMSTRIHRYRSIYGDRKQK